MKKILVPCDFSTNANAAFKTAVELAAASKGEVHVLHVIDIAVPTETAFGVQPYYISTEILREFAASAEKKFQKMKARLKDTKVKVSLSIKSGPVSLTIGDYITNKKMTLVVMGTHGASGWKEFVVGSNTEKIVRSSPVPVIALRKAMTKRSIRHIVLPTTLELDQTAFMNQVKDLQEFFRAKIHVLFLNTPANFVRDADSIASLKDFARYYKLRNFTLNVRSEHQESDGIIHFAKEIKANMIAMGTHGRKGLSHLMTGSIAEDVVNHLQLPIWTSQLRRE